MNTMKNETNPIYGNNSLLTVEKKRMEKYVTLSSKTNEVFSSSMVIRTKPGTFNATNQFNNNSGASSKKSSQINILSKSTAMGKVKEIPGFYSICFSSNPRGGIICFKNEELNEQESQRVMKEVETKVKIIQRIWKKYYYTIVLANNTIKRTIDINYRSNSFDDKEGKEEKGGTKLRAVAKRLVPSKINVLPQCFTKQYNTNFTEFNQKNLGANFKYRAKKQLQNLEKLKTKNKVVEYWINEDIEPENNGNFTYKAQKKKLFIQQIQSFALNVKSFLSEGSNTMPWTDFSKIINEDTFTLLKKKRNYDITYENDIFIEKLDKTKFFRVKQLDKFNLFANKPLIWNRQNEIEHKEKLDIGCVKLNIFWALKSYNGVDYIFHIGRNEKEILYQLSKKDIMNLWNKLNKVQHIHTGQQGMNYIIETFNNTYERKYPNVMDRKNFMYVDNNKIDFCINRCYQKENEINFESGRENSIYFEGSQNTRTPQPGQIENYNNYNQIQSNEYNYTPDEDNPSGKLRAGKRTNKGIKDENNNLDNSEIDRSNASYSRAWNSYIIPAQESNLKIMGAQNKKDLNDSNGFSQNMSQNRSQIVNSFNQEDNFDRESNKNISYTEVYKKRVVENSKEPNDVHNESFNSLLRKGVIQQDIVTEYEVNVIKNDSIIKKLHGSSSKKDNSYINKVKTISPDKSRKNYTTTTGNQTSTIIRTPGQRVITTTASTSIVGNKNRTIQKVRK